MADAARSARSAFQDIGNSARSGSRDVEGGTIDVRHQLGLLDNSIRGNHAAAMTDLIRLFQNTSFVMAALPFAGVIGGLLLVSGTVVEAIKKIKELKEAREKLNNDETGMDTAINTMWDGYNNRILEAEQRTDELRNNHLAALKIQLQIIDNQSMGELIKSLETVAKAADIVFKDLQGNWYSLGIGSDGASHALQQFKTQYDNLLSQGKEKEATDLLHGTLASAQRILALQQQMVSFGGGHTAMSQKQLDTTWEANRNELKRAGVGYSQKEVEAQEQLVQALSAQVTSETKIAELKKLDQGNATLQTGNEESARRASAAKEAIDSQARMASMALSADKSTSDAQLEIQHASIEQRLQNDLDFANRSLAAQLTANSQEQAALDKSGKDYTNQLKALQDKALEIQQQHDTQVAELRSRAAVEIAQRGLQQLETGEREKIDATQQGSAARLAAINAAIKEEESKGLQQSQFYRDLLQQRVEVTRQMTQEQNKLAEDAGKETAEFQRKMGETALAAKKEKQDLLNSAHRVTVQEQMQLDIKYADDDFKLKQDALNREIAALDQSGKEYENKLKALQEQEKLLVQQHENDVTAIQEKAEIDRNQRILSAEQSFNNSISSQLTQMLMRHETFGKMMVNIGDQVVSGMIENAIKSMLADDMTKEKDAAAAARKMFLAGTHFPFPINIVMAPALGAMAFASVMAFEGGTDRVPGVGNGDTTPALLTPGEGVVPGGVMDGLRNVARNGGFNNAGNTVHLHYRPTYHVQAIDRDGVQDMLNEHEGTFTQHFHNAVRKMNK